MSEYIPTTEQVRLTFALSADEREGSDRNNVAIWEGVLEQRAEFDRWLAAHDAAAKAEAWDEGFDAHPDWAVNPYREAT